MIFFRIFMKLAAWHTTVMLWNYYVLAAGVLRRWCYVVVTHQDIFLERIPSLFLIQFEEGLVCLAFITPACILKGAWHVKFTAGCRMRIRRIKRWCSFLGWHNNQHCLNRILRDDTRTINDWVLLLQGQRARGVTLSRRLSDLTWNATPAFACMYTTV